MKKQLLVILLIFVFFSGNSQILIPKKDYVPEVRKARYSFAFSLIGGVNSTLVSFGIMRELPDSTREIIFLTRNAFLRQVSGAEESFANPGKINFFEEYNIAPETIDELWKLKYAKLPYSKDDLLGWGSEFDVPSPMQFELLNEFGIYEIFDYSYGDDLWRLLRKMNNKTWVGTYQSRK